MKILVTGTSGQVGFELMETLAPLVSAAQLLGVDRRQLDLADPDAIRTVLRAFKPDVIVNPAAYTAVDKAESDRDAAFKVNAIAPGVIGEEAKRLSALVVHLSTDYVFDGAKSAPYTESDATHPQSVYGESKRDGELALAQATDQHLIFRTSWVVGRHGNNFAKTMLRLAAERDSLKVVADQWGAPTSARLLAEQIALIVTKYEAWGDPLPKGTFHLAARGETNWCEYARFVITEAIEAGYTVKAGPEAILPITTSDYPTPAKRPPNSRLSTHKFIETFGQLPPWQDGVRAVLRDILKQHSAKA